MEKLGIEPIQLLTQLFNFIVMVFILTKLLYKPLNKVLEERKRKIAEGLAYTQKMQEESEKSEQKREEVITEAKKEARKIIEEGKKSGKKLEEEIIEKAHKEAEAVLVKARKEIELERQDLEKSMRVQTVEIASAMTEKVLMDVLSGDDHRTIIDKKLKEIANLRKS